MLELSGHTGLINPRYVLAEDGRAFAGSRRQLQIYVNHRQAELSRAILDSMGELGGREATLTWVSPVARTHYTEFRDGAFLRVFIPYATDNWGFFRIRRDVNDSELLSVRFCASVPYIQISNQLISLGISARTG